MATPAARTRSRRRIVLAAASVVLLGGCGFELRRAPALNFSTIQLRGFADRSPLAEELRAQIDASRTTLVVDSIAQAVVVLEALADAREKSVVASTSAGQVRELQLRSRFVFQLSTKSGRILIPTREIRLSRDMSYSETIALAKEQEEAALFRAMQGDIAAQVMRILSAVSAI